MMYIESKKILNIKNILLIIKNKMSRGDYALEQEKYSVELIEKANNEKDGLLKLAKDMAKKEIDLYNEEKRNEYSDKVTDLNSNVQIIEDIENKSKVEIDELRANYNSRKDEVVNFLFENVIKVKYEVPDVVKGFFEEKFGITD